MNNWISVKDRLPRPNERVLCCFEDGFMATVDTDSSGEWELWVDSGDVTHWTTLPPAPEKKAEKATDDSVNSPPHYTQNGKKECIREMLEKFGTKAVMDFCRLNAYKYDYRADFKNGDEDRQKSAWYSGFLKALEILEEING